MLYLPADNMKHMPGNCGECQWLFKCNSAAPISSPKKRPSDCPIVEFPRKQRAVEIIIEGIQAIHPSFDHSWISENAEGMANRLGFK